MSWTDRPPRCGPRIIHRWTARSWCRGSKDISVVDNILTDYKNGIVYLEVDGLDISHNDISGLQGDALKGGGIQDAVFSYNHVHDLLGSTQVVNHSDMIQIFGAGRSIVTNNVEIFGNVLDNGNGAASQGIFIRNEDFSKNGYYQNINIHDNIVYAASYQGIGLNDTQGANVSDNTVIWAQHSDSVQSLNGLIGSYEPRIIMTNAPGATVNGNLVGDSIVNGTKLAGNNYILDFSDSTDPDYAGNHLVNYGGDGSNNLVDLQLATGSPLYGMFGAPMSSGGTAFANPTTPTTPTPPAPTPPAPPVVDTTDPGTQPENLDQAFSLN